MRAIDTIKAARNKRKMEEDLREIEVPEWDLTLYFDRISVADFEAAQMRANTKSTVDQGIEMLIRCALDRDGDKMFTIGDKVTLKVMAEMHVINRVVDFMLQEVPDTEASDKELGKNEQPSS